MQKGLQPRKSKAYVLDSNLNLHLINTSINTKYLSNNFFKVNDDLMKPNKNFTIWGKLKMHRADIKLKTIKRKTNKKNIKRKKKLKNISDKLKKLYSYEK